MNKCKLGFIGAGNMASAIARGTLTSGILPAQALGFYDIDAEKVKPFTELGARALPSLGALVEGSEAVLFAVKPQQIEAVLAEAARHHQSETLYISIAAGISAGYIQSFLGAQAKIVTVMPNTPLLLGYGAVALAQLPGVSDAQFAFVRSLFDAAGITEQIPADRMNEVIPLNGSAPAFIYRFAQIFVERGVELGFSAEVANRLFCQALIGSAHMMLESGYGHQELITMVSSKGGTTIEGLRALERCGFEPAVRACIDDCIRRAYEIGR